MIGIICNPMGGIVSGWLGRRKVVLIMSPLLASGWIIIGLASNKMMLYSGRVVSAGKNEA